MMLILAQRAVKEILKVSRTGILSIYLAGHPHPKDVTNRSDVDLFIIVDKSFPLSGEKSIKTHLASLGFPKRIGVRIFNISDFQCRVQGKIVFDDVRLYIKLFRLNKFKLLYGTRFDFSRFPLQSISNIDELRMDIGVLKESVTHYLQSDYKEMDPYPNMYNTAKWVLHVAQLERVFEGKMYIYEYYLLPDAFPKEHIVQIAHKIRHSKTKMSLAEKKMFVEQVQRYIKFIENSYLQK